METNSYKDSNNRKMEWNKAYFVAPTTYVKPSITYPADAFKYEPLTGKWFTLLPDDQSFYKLTLFDDVRIASDALPEPKTIYNTQFVSGQETVTIQVPALNNGESFSFLIYSIGSLNIQRDNFTQVTLQAGLYRVSCIKKYYKGSEYKVELVSKNGYVVKDYFEGIPNNINISFAGIAEKTENVVKPIGGSAQGEIDSEYPNISSLVDTIIQTSASVSGSGVYMTKSSALSQGFNAVDDWMVANGFDGSTYPFNANAIEIKKISQPNSSLPVPPEHTPAPAATTYESLRKDWFGVNVNLQAGQTLDWYYYNIEIIDVSVGTPNDITDFEMYFTAIKSLPIAVLNSDYPIPVNFGTYNSTGNSQAIPDVFVYTDVAGNRYEMPRSEVKYCGGLVAILKTGMTVTDMDNDTVRLLPESTFVRKALFVVKTSGSIILYETPDNPAYAANTKHDSGYGTGIAHYIDTYGLGAIDSAYSETQTFFKIY
jgi:hypothetical protein